jgi:hypothetical protein
MQLPPTGTIVNEESASGQIGEEPRGLRCAQCNAEVSIESLEWGNEADQPSNLGVFAAEHFLRQVCEHRPL